MASLLVVAIGYEQAVPSLGTRYEMWIFVAVPGDGSDYRHRKVINKVVAHI